MQQYHRLSFVILCVIQIKEKFESFVPYIEEDRIKKSETLRKYKLELQELNKRELELQKLKMDLQIATEKYTANMYADVPELVYFTTGMLHYRTR